MNDNFAQQVKFSIKEKEVATVIVNGVAQQPRKIQYVVVTCPNCGSELMAFQDGIPLVDIYKELSLHSPIENFPKYCHECGTKITCDKSVVDEQIVEEQ